MITAQQAREMIIVKELSLEEIESRVKMMSEAGHNFWVTDTKCIVSEQTMTQLKDLGYSVSFTSNPF